jgi:hypothetical protein
MLIKYAEQQQNNKAQYFYISFTTGVFGFGISDIEIRIIEAKVLDKRRAKEMGSIFNIISKEEDMEMNTSTVA